MRKVKERIPDGKGGFEIVYEEIPTVNILGTDYAVTVKKYSEDESFGQKDIAGYCNSMTKEIVLCDMSTYKGWENETKEAIEIYQKCSFRHEIVHAFFNESGLMENSLSVDAWAGNEEMVDWIAIQGPKIYRAWQEAGAL